MGLLKSFFLAKKKGLLNRTTLKKIIKKDLHNKWLK